MKEYNPSKLFNKQGYIPIKDYIEDIDYMLKNGPWKLPLRFIDFLHFYFLKLVVKVSWFRDILYIINDSSISPSYLIIFRYLKKMNLFDGGVEIGLHFRGYFGFYLEKNVTRNGRTFTMSGQGVGKDKATAFSIALGEMVERAISGMYDMNKDIKFSSYNEIIKNDPAMYSLKYHRFLDVQKKKFKVLNYDPSVPIDWVGGVNLISKKKTYIPKQMTSWFNEDFSVKDVFVNSTTNGAAAYFTKDGAVLRGLLEVIQRDAFLVHWLTMIPPEIFVQESLPKEIKQKIKEFELFGIYIYVLNVTSIPIPSVIVVAINRHSKVPQVAVTGACAVTFMEAIDNALKEMILGLEMFYYVDAKVQSKYESVDVEPFISDFGKIARQLYWRGERRVEQFEWFLSGKNVLYDEICERDLICECDDFSKLEACLKVLENLGEDYYPVIYYPKNKIQEDLGFYVAQVFIPKAFPLYLSEYFGTFDSDRLQEFALSKNIPSWKLNPMPHMFP